MLPSLMDLLCVAITDGPFVLRVLGQVEINRGGNDSLPHFIGKDFSPAYKLYQKTADSEISHR